jgi:hypothetical protein
VKKRFSVGGDDGEGSAFVRAASSRQRREADLFLAQLLGQAPAASRQPAVSVREPFFEDGPGDSWQVVGRSGARISLHPEDLVVRKVGEGSRTSWRAVLGADARLLIGLDGIVGRGLVVLRRTTSASAAPAPLGVRGWTPALEGRSTARWVGEQVTPAPVVPAILPVYPGFDVSAWRKEIVWMWRWSNLRFIGLYLAHHATQTSTTWTNHWHDLRDLGWGLVPFWVPFSGAGINAMATADGAAHGRLAAARAREAHVEQGAAIYLDVEAPVLNGAAAGFVAYLRDWFTAVRAAGFTPGAYCSRLDASRLLGAEFAASTPVLVPFSIPRRTRAVWNDGTFDLAAPLPGTWDSHDPAWSASASAVGCQYDWFNSARDRKIIHWPTATGAAGATSDVDWEAAKTFDPSHPRAQGVVTLSADRGDPRLLHVFSVTVAGIDHLDRLATGTFSAARSMALGPADIGPIPPAQQSGYDAPWAAAISRRSACVDLFLQGLDGLVRTTWSNPQEAFPAHRWALHADPARKSSPIAAVSRELDQLDVFYVGRNHQLVTQWWNPQATDWGRNQRALAGPTVAGGSNLVALGRPATPAAGAVATTPSALDVFYISHDYSRTYTATPAWNDAWRVVRASWTTAVDWQLQAIDGLDPPAAFSGIAAARDSAGLINLVFQTRDRTGLRHATLTAPSTWNRAVGPGPLPLDGESPAWWMSLQLCSFPGCLLLTGVTSAGTLAWATFAGGRWSAVSAGAATFSTGRPIAVAPRGNDRLDVLGLTELGAFVSRTLQIAPGGAVTLLP